MILPGIIPLNDYLALPDCSICNSGKLLYIPNSYQRICTMCNKVTNEVERITQGDPKQVAIDKWMGKDNA